MMPAHAEGVRIEHPWARAAIAGGTGAFYCTLFGGTADDAVSGMDTPAAGMTMLHQSTPGSVASMRDLPEVRVPAGERVQLAPGGTHAMLMDASPSLHPGGMIRVTLHFKRSADITVDAPVVRAGGQTPYP